MLSVKQGGMASSTIFFSLWYNSIIGEYSTH